MKNLACDSHLENIYRNLIKFEKLFEPYGDNGVYLDYINHLKDLTEQALISLREENKL